MERGPYTKVHFLPWPKFTLLLWGKKREKQVKLGRLACHLAQNEKKTFFRAKSRQSLPMSLAQRTRLNSLCWIKLWIWSFLLCMKAARKPFHWSLSGTHTSKLRFSFAYIPDGSAFHSFLRTFNLCTSVFLPPFNSVTAHFPSSTLCILLCVCQKA